MANIINKCSDCGKQIANRYAKRCNSCAHKGNLNHFFGKKHSAEALLKISKNSLGRKHKEETKQKIAELNRGPRNKWWKGESVGYRGLHQWVQRHLGKPMKCSECKSENIGAYHWANISGEYKRDLSDWKRLCVPCHSKFDMSR